MAFFDGFSGECAGGGDSFAKYVPSYLSSLVERVELIFCRITGI
jgi:hypothetical protein